MFAFDKKAQISNGVNSKNNPNFRYKASLAAALAAVMIFAAVYFLAVPPTNFPSAKIFEIREGDNLQKISSELVRQGYIRSRSLFEFAVVFAGNSKNLQFGDYLFERPLSLMEIARRIGEGVFGIARIKITIPEGSNLYEIGALFEQAGMFTKKELFAVTGIPGADYGSKVAGASPLLRDFSGEADLLLGKPRLVSLEGYLFPDTYFFLKSDTPEDVVIKMLSNLERRITPELREDIARQGKSIHDVLTVASLLEEEAREDEDRRIIAGILWKRIEKGMPLQVDAALTYVTGKASLSLSNGDLRQDSPYNTYKQKGLPLGPISNPGLAAIDAALHPAETEYLFYLSDRTGILYYAKTHEGHVANKRKYLSRE